MSREIISAVVIALFVYRSMASSECLAELPALHQIRALRDTDLVVQELSQGLKGQVPLIQSRHSAEKLVAQDVEARFGQTRHGKQVDHLVGINGSADHLSYGHVDVALAGMPRAGAGLVGQSLADHRGHPLEEGQMRRDGFGFWTRHREREGR